MFIYKYKQSEVVEDYNNFLKKIKEFKLYIVEFEKNGIIKAKIYLSDYIVKKLNQYLIIVIIYDEYIFFTNNNI